MNPIQLRSEQVESITELRELPGGGRELEIRGQFWGTWSCAGAVALRPDSDPEMREAPDGERQLPGEGQASFIIGTASSTGVDMHGTEMSREALDSMARQMGDERGVSYAPTHPEREWHEIIGRTVRADVIPVDSVANAADEGEAAYLLRVAAQIDPEHPRGRDLIRALRNGVQVGQSIGGWFTRVRVEENDRGEIERIIVLDVVLDHLAATRTPSNQDSDDLAELRSKLSAAMRSMHDGKEGPTPPTTDPEQRHVLDVEDAGDVVRVTYAKADGELSEHGEEDEDETRDKAGDLDAAPEAIEPSVGEEAREAETAINPSEATAEETHDEESEMDMDELKSMLEGVVGKANEGVTAEIRSITERLEALESRGTPAAEEQEEEAVDVEALVAERAAALVAEREAELQAKLEAADARKERDGKLVDRLLQRSVRETRAYDDGELHALLAVDDGDFSDIIERVEKGGRNPAMVAVSRKSRAIKKVRDADDADPVSMRDMRNALRDLCKAAELDGLVQAPERGSFR